MSACIAQAMRLVLSCAESSISAPNKTAIPGFLLNFSIFFFFCSESVSLFSARKVDNENEFPKSLVGCLGGFITQLREMKQAPAARGLPHFARVSNYYELSCRGKTQLARFWIIHSLLRGVTLLPTPERRRQPDRRMPINL